MRAGTAPNHRVNTRDTVWGDLLLLAELLQRTRRRRHAAATICLALPILVGARDIHGALADLSAYFVRCAYAARSACDLESAAAFELAVDVTRVHRGADVAQRRARGPRSIAFGATE